MSENEYTELLPEGYSTEEWEAMSYPNRMLALQEVAYNVVDVALLKLIKFEIERYAALRQEVQNLMLATRIGEPH